MAQDRLNARCHARPVSPPASMLLTTRARRTLAAGGGGLALALPASGLPGANARPAAPAAVGAAGATAPSVAAPANATASLERLPVSFIANAGQSDAAVRFEVRGRGHTLRFTE